ELGVLLPARISHQRQERGIGPDRHAGEEARSIVRARRIACYGRMARLKCEGDEEGGGNDQSAHLAHCWLLESDGASWHKCRRACHRDLQFGKKFRSRVAERELWRSVSMQTVARALQSRPCGLRRQSRLERLRGARSSVAGEA